MLAGATGSRLEPLRALHFSVSETLARDRSDPSEMSRPFDADRDGSVLGEGAGALVLESLEHAVARGAKIWGEVVAGVGSAVGHRFDGKDRDFIRLATHNVLAGLIDKATSLGMDLTADDWHIHACGKGEVDSDRSEAMGIHDSLGADSCNGREKLLRQPGCGVRRRRNRRKLPCPGAPEALPDSQLQSIGCRMLY